MDDLLFVDEAKGLSPLVEGSILGHRDHLVNILPYGTSPCPGGLDSAVFKNLSGKATKKCSPLVRRSVEFGHLPSMPHCENPRAIVHDGKVVLKTSQV